MRPQPIIPTMKPEEPSIMMGDKCTRTYDFATLTKTDEWIHLAPARFGLSRPCSFSRSTRWTGDSYRYDLFRHRERPWMGLRWSHAETGWLIEYDRSASGVHLLLSHIAALPDESTRWDFCHLIAQSIEKTGSHAKEEEATRWQTAILNKHIRIRRRHGLRQVHILAPWEMTEANSQPSPSAQ